MSRSTFLNTNDVSTSKTMSTSIQRNNPRVKRNLRDKRRPTGIRPTDISLASTSTEGSTNEDDGEEENPSTTESCDLNQTLTSSPVKSINRVQSTFEKLSIPRTDKSPHSCTPPDTPIKSSSSNRIFRSEEFRQTSDDDSSRQFEQRILALESMLYEKDDIIHDLKQKLENKSRELNNAEEQIYKLHQDKLTLIKAFTTIQETKSPSTDHSIHSNFLPRN